MTKNLCEDYERAGFGKRVGFGKRPAVILIDFVAAYFLETSPLYSVDVFPKMQAALGSALRIREVAHRTGVPVFLTKVELTAAEIAANLMFRKTSGAKLFEMGSVFAAFASGLTPRSDEIVISKQHASGFLGTPLASLLATKGIDNLIITGLSTSGCVRATCTDSVGYGYYPIVVSDAVADRDERPHEANLFDMASKYADVVQESETLQYLESFN